jgi:hypothetical protein
MPTTCLQVLGSHAIDEEYCCLGNGNKTHRVVLAA